MKPARQAISIIGVPLDLGASRRGVDMGPSALRVTGLARQLAELGHEVVDTGDVDVPLPEECGVGVASMRYSEPIRQVCEDLCARTAEALKAGRTPIILGGDHSIAMGSIGGVAKHFRAAGKKIGVIWFDAHGDMNTPDSSPSGNVHGMPLAASLGLGHESLTGIGGFSPKVDPAHTVLVGIRDLDSREKRLIADSGVRVITMKEIDQRGVSATMADAIRVAGEGTAGIHVSFDIDSCDPSVAPGVGTPKRGGLSYREAHLCLELIADSNLLLAVDMVEVNPIFDTRNSTAEFGAELICSALGQQIF
jgi:arginase